jgi:hypothetical protein
MKPGRKSRVAAKTRKLPVDLQKDFLSKVFRVSAVSQHSQAQRIDPAMVLFVQLFKRD